MSKIKGWKRTVTKKKIKYNSIAMDPSYINLVIIAGLIIMVGYLVNSMQMPQIKKQVRD